MKPPIDYLCPHEIALDLEASTRWEALRAVGALIERSRGLDAPPLFRALWRREQAQSTALGHGIAVPHARIMRISEPITAYVRTRLPIAFGAPDRGPISELFVLLVPEGDDNTRHLELLALIAEMFSEVAFRARLGQAADVDSVRAIFQLWVAGKVATLGALTAAAGSQPAPRAST